MREEIISDVTYRIGSLNAKQQFNVLRRLGPVFAAAKPAAKLWVEQATQSEAGTERPPLDAGRLVDALPAGELAQLHREINALPETDRKAIGSLLIALVTMETQRCR